MSDQEYYYSESDSSIFNSDEEIPKEEYPLKYTWTFYDHIKSDSNTYQANTRKLCEFDNVIKFWQIFNNYPKPSSLFNNGACKPTMGGKEISSLSLFKKGIEPIWEDPVNKLGAEISKRRFKRNNPLEEIDKDWFDIIMACVGEQLDPSITGVRVVDSSGLKKPGYSGRFDYKLLYRIELWFDDINKREVIEENFKKILNLDLNYSIHYKEHSPRDEPEKIEELKNKN